MDTAVPVAPSPTVADIEAAARRLTGKAVRTPLLESPLLNDRLGRRLLVKAEPLQRTGSFKFRGAYAKMSLIPADRRPAGIVAYSSGNHAQGVAAAARLLGMPATIVMPKDAPAIKQRNTAAWGARIVPYDRYGEDREAIGAALTRESGATLVPPYDDVEIIAGQGTIGLEMAEQLAEADAEPSAILVCCGGGGLVAGTSLALSVRLPGVPIYAVEPEGFDDTARSLASGERLGNRPEARSICDALLSPMPGAVTLPINRRTLSGGLVVSDDEVRRAMAVAFETLKLVVEPGGAVALAAALSGKAPAGDGPMTVVCSGGNVDAEQFAEILRNYS